jgi:IS5 family transposase
MASVRATMVLKPTPEDGFIKATASTEGNVHDSNHFVDLLSGKKSAVYADNAYKSTMIGLKITTLAIKR